MYLDILKDHLGFIERFYNCAAEPFETRMRKIEAGEDPFTPQRAPGDDDGSEYLAEWSYAYEGLAVLGSCSLGLLEKALHDYLREFVGAEGGPGQKKPKESWFDHHCRFLEENTAFRWANSPVSKDQLEEINLTRNTFAHDEMLGSTWPLQTEHHFRKNPVAAFGDKPHLAALKGKERDPEFPVALKVTRENLTIHIGYAREFCTYVEGQKRKW
jgi:hypothetical protein